jgi:hypothetical protein
MHAGDHRHAIIIEGISAEDSFIKIISGPRITVSLVDGDVVGPGVALAAHQLARQVVEAAVFRIIDEPMTPGGGRGYGSEARHHRQG